MVVWQRRSTIREIREICESRSTARKKQQRQNYGAGNYLESASRKWRELSHIIRWGGVSLSLSLISHISYPRGQERVSKGKGNKWKGGSGMFSHGEVSTAPGDVPVIIIVIRGIWAWADGQ